MSVIQIIANEVNNYSGLLNNIIAKFLLDVAICLTFSKYLQSAHRG